MHFYFNIITFVLAILTGLIITRDVSLAGAAFYIRYMSLPPPVSLSMYIELGDRDVLVFYFRERCIRFFKG